MIGSRKLSNGYWIVRNNDRDLTPFVRVVRVAGDYFVRGGGSIIGGGPYTTLPDALAFVARQLPEDRTVENTSEN